MKSEESILKEIEHRQKMLPRARDYTTLRFNKAIIETLKAVLEMPNHISWHLEEK